MTEQGHNGGQCHPNSKDNQECWMPRNQITGMPCPSPPRSISWGCYMYEYLLSKRSYSLDYFVSVHLIFVYLHININQSLTWWLWRCKAKRRTGWFRKNCVFFTIHCSPSRARLHRCEIPSKLSTQCEYTVNPFGCAGEGEVAIFREKNTIFY